MSRDIDAANTDRESAANVEEIEHVSRDFDAATSEVEFSQASSETVSVFGQVPPDEEHNYFLDQNKP